MNCLWTQIRQNFTEQLAQGQPSEYYEQIIVIVKLLKILIFLFRKTVKSFVRL